MPLLQDIRYTWRLFWRAPAPAVIALLSISLSVGATAVVFTAIQSVLIRPLPYERPEELVQIGTDIRHVPELSRADIVFWDDIEEVSRNSRTLESVGAYGNAILNLAGDDSSPPEALYGLRVTASLFPTLGVSPMLGRSILPEEDQAGHADVILLSYSLWVRRFNSDPGVVGREIAVDSRDCMVLGVMPPGFDFPLRRGAIHTPSPHFEFWAPLSINPRNKTGGLGAVARLRPGVSLSQARDDLASISNALAREFPDTNRDRTLRMSPLRDRIVGFAANGLLLLLAAALLFLFIGCANVANLLLVQGLQRRREIAVRIAVGAGRARIVRQLLTESCVLAATGGLGGFILTVAAWQVLPAVVPTTIPRLDGARADWTVFGFALLVALASGIFSGVVPALRAASRKLPITPGDFGGRGATGGQHDRTRSLFVVAEVAVAVVLVVVGGQLLGSFVRLLGADPGFQADRVHAFVVLPSPERYATPEQKGTFYGQILDSVRLLPGVESAGTVDALPFSGENHPDVVWTNEPADQPGTAPSTDPLPAEVNVVSADYLQTMGVRLKEGRWFREEETRGSNDLAIVSDFAADRLWPGTTAVGKQLCVYCSPDNPNHWKRVIGVVSSVRHAALDEPMKAAVYLSGNALERAVFLVVGSDRPGSGLDRAVRRTIAAIDPNQPVFLSASLRSLIADSLADRRFIMTLLAAAGCLALLLSGAGVYGVASYATSRRRKEIGIRMALGATPGEVQSLICRQGLRDAAIGFALGLFAAMTLKHALRHVLIGLEAGDAAPIWVAVALVMVTMGIACWIPARRASRMDPLPALSRD